MPREDSTVGSHTTLLQCLGEANGAESWEADKDGRAAQLILRSSLPLDLEISCGSLPNSLQAL